MPTCSKLSVKVKKEVAENEAKWTIIILKIFQYFTKEECVKKHSEESLARDLFLSVYFLLQDIWTSLKIFLLYLMKQKYPDVFQSLLYCKEILFSLYQCISQIEHRSLSRTLNQTRGSSFCCFPACLPREGGASLSKSCLSLQQQHQSVPHGVFCASTARFEGTTASLLLLACSSKATSTC